MSDADAVAPAWHEALPFTLWRAHTVVHKRVLAALADIDVTATQLGFAVQLSTHGLLSGSDLGRLLKVTPQSAAAALLQLEERAWVVRVPHPTHGKIILYRLTPAGEDIVAQGRARMSAVDAELSALLGRDRVSALARALTALAADLDP